MRFELDTEDRERICHYYEELMNIVGLESSGGHLNNFMYGFDPAKIKDNATFEKPHQYAEGMLHVFVNAVAVLKDGEHTGATPGRFVKGPGWKK